MSIEACNKKLQSQKIQKDLFRIETEKAARHLNYSTASDVLKEMHDIIDRAKVTDHE